MISVVCFKWAKPGYRSTFTAQHVNTLRSMVARHYPDPHRFICITDDAAGIDADIECVPLWNTYGDLKNPTWPDIGPSCYRRLKAFSAEFEEIAGPRFVCVDLDVVITGDLRPLWNRSEDFVIYASWKANYSYNGSMFMMTAGARRQVWDTFDPLESPQQASAAGMTGSDQAWIQYCLGKKEATWTVHDGVYSYHHLRTKQWRLPADARIVFFHGPTDPWSEEAARQSPWVRKYYR